MGWDQWLQTIIIHLVEHLASSLLRQWTDTIPNPFLFSQTHTNTHTHKNSLGHTQIHLHMQTHLSCSVNLLPLDGHATPRNKGTKIRLGTRYSSHLVGPACTDSKASLASKPHTIHCIAPLFQAFVSFHVAFSSECL